jgi:hypothetical protein
MSHTLVPTQTHTPLPPTPENPVVIRAIYADELDLGWSTQNSEGGDIDLQATLFSYQGSDSIAFTPEIDFGSILFSVEESNPEPYLRSQVIGFSFWVYCETDYIGSGDLAVTVTGSNQYPYWIPTDDSVTNRFDPIFSETRLYFLGYNSDIPPKTWAEVSVVLDDLIYDPVYTYVTGLLIKSDEDFRNTVYIDQVDISLLEEDTIPTSATATPLMPDETPRPTITPTR